MTVEDGRFTTDGKKFQPCCESMKRDIDGSTEKNEFVYDKDTITYETLGDEDGYYYTKIGPLAKFCPYCGAILELLNKVKDKTGE